MSVWKNAQRGEENLTLEAIACVSTARLAGRRREQIAEGRRYTICPIAGCPA